MIKSANMYIWGREFTVPVDYNCYPGETLLPEQTDAIKTFLENPEWLEQAKILVEQFCEEQLMEDCENTKKDNIFSYIKKNIQNGVNSQETFRNCNSSVSRIVKCAFKPLS